MTIRHFYFVLAYVIWGYIVFCCLAKLFVDWCRRKRTAKRRRAIERYFQPSGAADRKKCKRASVLRWGRDPVLLTCVCRAYKQNLSQYSAQEQQAHQELIVKLLDSASDCVGEDGMKACYTIAAMADSCGLTTDEVENMQPQEKPESELEEYWYSVAVKRRWET